MMRRSLLLLAFVGLLTLPAFAQVTVVDVPGASSTYVMSINNGGDVAGYYCATDNCDVTNWRGFVRESNGRMSTFDGVPWSINDAGTVTGYVYNGRFSGFIRDRRGNVTVFGDPFPPGPIAKFGTAINNRGEIAGYSIMQPGSDAYRGFLRTRRGYLTTFMIPMGLVPTGINGRGDIAGHTAPFYLPGNGFVRDRNGVITTFEVTGASGLGTHAYPVGINNAGDVTGYFYESANNRLRGFIRGREGKFTVFDASANAAKTMSAAINERGDVAGIFEDGYFLRRSTGEVTVFSVPDTCGIGPTDQMRGGGAISMNNRGDIAGTFLDCGTSLARGFVRSGH